MKDSDNRIIEGDKRSRILFIAIVVLSFVVGTLLTHEVEGLKISAIVARSLALLLVPASFSIIIFLISILVKKKMTRKTFINLASILWLLGVCTDLITYYIL